ncbi:MAG: TonB C-terminal domain-containing protein [Desulfovibrio sp.]|nr:TonB C-terminal domain-containing protein [Desulfovibrio sp.]
MDFDRLPSFAASFCLHLVIAALVIFMPGSSAPPPAPPGAVMVSGLVTIGKEGRSAQGKQETPDSGKGQEENNSAPPKPVEPVEPTKPAEPPQPPKPVEQAPEPEVTAPKPPDPEATVIPKTPEKPEPPKPEPPKEEVKKPEAPKPEPKKPEPPKPVPPKAPVKTPPSRKEDLSSALADLGREVKSGQGSRSGTAKGNNRNNAGRDLSRALADLGKNVGGAGDGLSGSGPGGSGGDGLGILGAYQESVISRVRPNWALPARADRKSYTAVVNIKIDKDGTILEARIVKPSGNSFFDSSVMQAVAATRILEPPPHAGYSSIDISFTPEALSAN